MSQRRRNIYLLLILSAVMALAVDRLVLTNSVTTPESIFATPVTSPEFKPSTPFDTTNEIKIAPILPFPSNLPVINAQQQIIDIFQPVPLRGQVRQGLGVDDQGKGKRSGLTRLDASSFESQRQLSGVMVAGSVKVAIVDGKWIRVGEKIWGCQLESVSGNQAHFKCHNGPATLKVGKYPGIKGN